MHDQRMFDSPSHHPTSSLYSNGDPTTQYYDYVQWQSLASRSAPVYGASAGARGRPAVAALQQLRAGTRRSAPWVLVPKKRQRQRCTCPYCVSGANSKATNLNDPPAKKKHVCHYPNCSKVYRKSSDIRVHFRSHTGECPFICHWHYCKKSFTRSDELQCHVRTHTGEKRFVCPECWKPFGRTDHLKKHKQIHQRLKEKAAESEASTSAGSSDSKEVSEQPTDSPSPPPPLTLCDNHEEWFMLLEAP